MPTGLSRFSRQNILYEEGLQPLFLPRGGINPRIAEENYAENLSYSAFSQRLIWIRGFGSHTFKNY